MKKSYAVLALVLLTLALPTSVLAGGPTIDKLLTAGWHCEDIAGAYHCFDPGDGHSANSASINVSVFDYDGHFEGTEQLWRADLYAGQPCPQDALIDLGFYIACHHYGH